MRTPEVALFLRAAFSALIFVSEVLHQHVYILLIQSQARKTSGAAKLQVRFFRHFLGPSGLLWVAVRAAAVVRSLMGRFENYTILRVAYPAPTHEQTVKNCCR
jgi:hypothetical protein